MILIADSGSTKTNWVLLDDHLRISDEFVTQGLNPNVLTTEQIQGVLTDSNAISNLKDSLTKLFFYGSGCGNTSNQDKMKLIFTHSFPSASVDVKSDLYAAAFATCGNKTGIVCILGTGSNSCFYNGENIDGANFNLGYLLGDEGSGCAFGKRLLRDFFYGILPEDLRIKFATQYPISRDELIRHIYQEPFPNQYIASFVPFIKENISHPYCSYLVNFGLDEFLKIFVTSIVNYPLWPVHFVGSIAEHFKDLLMENCKSNSIVIGQILQSPIHQLAEYHQLIESR